MRTDGKADLTWCRRVRKQPFETGAIWTSQADILRRIILSFSFLEAATKFSLWQSRRYPFHFPILAKRLAKVLETDPYFSVSKINDARSQGSAIFLENFDDFINTRRRSGEERIKGRVAIYQANFNNDHMHLSLGSAILNYRPCLDRRQINCFNGIIWFW